MDNTIRILMCIIGVLILSGVLAFVHHFKSINKDFHGE